MALTLGLSSADFAAYLDQLGAPVRRVRRRAEIWDLDHNLIQDVSDHLLPGGQVDVADASRSCTVQLWDPTYSIGFDTADPAAGTVVPRYLIALWRDEWVDVLDRFVVIPLGVFWAFPSRAGDVVNISGKDKSEIVSYPWTNPASLASPATFKAGTGVLLAIKQTMELTGETRFAFTLADSSATLAKEFKVTPDQSPWSVAQKFAQGIGWHLFYNADGYLECKPRAAEPASRSAAVFTFAGGVGGTLREVGEVGYGSSSLTNAVVATGATPEGWNAPITKFAQVGDSDTLNITRNGKRVYFRANVSDTAADTNTKVNTLAQTSLTSSKLLSVGGGFDSSPVAHLEPGDQVGYVNSEGVWVPFNFNSASIPFGVGSQSNGYNRRVSYPSRRITRLAA